MERRIPAKVYITFGIIALILISLISCFNIYFEYNAYKEIGENFLEVFFTNFKVKLIFQALSFILVFALSFMSILFLSKNLRKIDSLYDFLNKKSVVLLVSALLSGVISVMFQVAVYDKFLLFKNASLLEVSDPVFNKDLGYYIFKWPFYSAVFDALTGVFFLIFAGVLILYVFLYLRLGITDIGNILNEKEIIIHNIVNFVLVVICKVISLKFDAYNMLYNNNASFTGAGYTSVNIWRHYYNIIPYALIIALVLGIILYFKKKRKLAVSMILVYPLIYIGFSVTAFFTQSFIVNPSEISLEREYILRNIEYTRAAYKVNEIKDEVFPIEYNLTAEDLNEEKNTVSNTRIIDYPSTLKAINQVQSIRNYYKFNDLDIVKYDILGEPTAVGIATREFNLENIKESAQSFINRRLRFTHGFGIAAVSVNSVTKEGQPQFFVKDIPSQSSVSELNVTQPRIYFGETDNDYVIAGSKYKELDYSLGDTDVEYSYTGSAGIRMTPLNKVLYSLYLGDFQLLISNYVDENSKLLINSNVCERVKKVAPFLSVDNDPYMIIDKDGSLKWIVNCYTKTRYYPYSKSLIMFGEEINYIRESVKAVVDAYNGDVKFYITDKNDAIANTYKKIYPSFFEDEDLPDSLSEHLQYPEAIFNAQSEILKRYHTKNPEIFYNKTDLWSYAKEKYEGEEKNVSPYYSIMTTFKDNGGLVLMIPYTMSGKQNLVGWLAVNCDKEGYGDMILYTFPKGENIYGVMQMENKIDNDPEISREMTLWGQGGSTVIRGNMLTIPVKNSLIYIEPVYISSGTQSSLPELKRIIVAYNNEIVMEETLEKALSKLFDYNMDNVLIPDDKVEENIENEETGNTKILVELYDKLKNSMQNGDWKTFGSAFDELEKEIEKIR